MQESKLNVRNTKLDLLVLEKINSIGILCIFLVMKCKIRLEFNIL